ncbi:MAG: hypothetical protein ACUZ8E_17335 [Candidatus Anammoxibacter sp.]
MKPIPIPENLGIDDLNDKLTGADDALCIYNKMLKGIKCANTATDGVAIGTELYDFITEHCQVPMYEDCAMDVICQLKVHIESQIARFIQLRTDLEGEIHDLTH